MSYFLRQTAGLLEDELRLGGEPLEQEHDGLILTKDQRLDGFGVDLGVLYGDHTEFTGSESFISAGRRPHNLYVASGPEVKAAFTRALVKNICS
jgi:hypothetical protein